MFAHCVEFAYNTCASGQRKLLTYLLSLRKSALYAVSLSVFCNLTVYSSAVFLTAVICASPPGRAYRDAVIIRYCAAVSLEAGDYGTKPSMGL